MRQWKFLSVFISFFAFNQEVEKITIHKESNNLPSISGVYQGKIAIEKLGDKNGIRTSSSHIIQSFEISYPYGSSYKTIEINSNQIPDSIILDIRKACLNEEIYITKIKAKKNDKIVILESMNLTPILNEN